MTFQTLAESERYRRAFQILEKRKFTLRYVYDKHSGWTAGSSWSFDFRRYLDGGPWPDPVTAVMKADEWYRENIDGKMV